MIVLWISPNPTLMRPVMGSNGMPQFVVASTFDVSFSTSYLRVSFQHHAVVNIEYVLLYRSLSCPSSWTRFERSDEFIPCLTTLFRVDSDRGSSCYLEQFRVVATHGMNRRWQHGPGKVSFLKHHQLRTQYIHLTCNSNLLNAMNM